MSQTPEPEECKWRLTCGDHDPLSIVLLRVCQQLKTECEAVLYGENVFWIACGEAYSQALKALGKSAVRKLRSIQLVVFDELDCPGGDEWFLGINH